MAIMIIKIEKGYRINVNLDQCAAVIDLIPI